MQHKEDEKNIDRLIFVQIGLNILYYRKAMRLTQQELAEFSNLSKNHIQKIENGIGTPSIAALVKISKVLNVHISKLFEER